MCDQSWILPGGHQLDPNSDRYLAPPSEHSVKEKSADSQPTPLSRSAESGHPKDNASEPTSEKEREETKGVKQEERESGDDMDSADEDSLLMSEVDSLAEQSLQQSKLERIRQSVEARRLSNATSIYQPSYSVLPKRQEMPRSQIPVLHQHRIPVYNVSSL